MSTRQIVDARVARPGASHRPRTGFDLASATRATRVRDTRPRHVSATPATSGWNAARRLWPRAAPLRTEAPSATRSTREQGPHPRSGCGPGSPEQIRTAVTALRGRRPRPLDDGAGRRKSYRHRSGGRTRTPNDRARTCCVADYTTPEGLGQDSQSGPTPPTRRDSTRVSRPNPKTRPSATPSPPPKEPARLADPAYRARARRRRRRVESELFGDQPDSKGMKGIRNEDHTVRATREEEARGRAQRLPRVATRGLAEDRVVRYPGQCRDAVPACSAPHLDHRDRVVPDEQQPRRGHGANDQPRPRRHPRRRSNASRSRASVRSRPRTTIDSKSGRPKRRPSMIE
jgi:hypothetical protein